MRRVAGMMVLGIGLFSGCADEVEHDVDFYEKPRIAMLDSAECQGLQECRALADACGGNAECRAALEAIKHVEKDGEMVETNLVTRVIERYVAQ